MILGVILTCNLEKNVVYSEVNIHKKEMKVKRKVDKSVTRNASILRALLVNKPGSPAWRRAYARYRRTEHWKKTREARLKSCSTCAMCPRKATEVHHRVYHWFNEDANNDLRSVCKFCHRKHHGK